MQMFETAITYLDKIRIRGPLKSGYTVIKSDDDEVHNGNGETADEEKEGRSRYYEEWIHKCSSHLSEPMIIFCLFFQNGKFERNESNYSDGSSIWSCH